MNIRMVEGVRQSRMPVEDASQVGEFRRIAQRLAEAYEFDATQAGRVGIVATELANNVLKHAGRGELLVQAFNDGHDISIELLAIDQGPGMQVEKCMRDGYSTSGTAGTGLGAISRLSTLFDVYSFPDRGTVAVSRIAKRASHISARSPTETPAIELGAICVAVAGEIDCGDNWKMATRGNDLAIMVADGLGHGTLASMASQSAAEAFGADPFELPSEAMRRMHRKLSGGRGAAAAIAILDGRKSNVTFAGVGNISGAIVAPERSKGMVSHNGTLGVQLLRTQQFEYGLAQGSKVVMHSDGISARWSLSDYPGLSVRHASVIAGVLYRDHSRQRDDVTIVVAGPRT